MRSIAFTFEQYSGFMLVMLVISVLVIQFNTSYGSSKLREDAFKLGFDAYFDKPFDNGVLIASLKKSLRICD